MKTCPRCGAPLSDEARFCPRCGAAYEEAPVPPPSGMPSYAYYYTSDAPAKKSKWRRVVTICAVVMLICGILFLAVAAATQVMRRRVKMLQNAMDYANAMLAYDGDAFSLLMPSDYLTYLTQTYAIEPQSLNDALSDYFYGGRPFLTAGDALDTTGQQWMEVAAYASDLSLSASSLSKDIKAQCEESLSEWGLKASSYGSADFTSDGEVLYAMPMACIGGEWVSVDGMRIAQEACGLLYGDDAPLPELASQYITAYGYEDTDTLHDMLPDACWAYLSGEYGILPPEADAMLADYVDGWSEVGDVKDVTCETGAIDWWSASEVANLNDSFDGYDIAFDDCVNITCTYQIVGSDDTYDGEYDVTVAEMDGDWVVLDAMLDYDDACYYTLTGSDGWDDGVAIEGDADEDENVLPGAQA